MGIKVTKMNSSGHDYILMDYDDFTNMNLTMSEVAKKICDRHFGVGADGLIIPYKTSTDADISWFLYNSDGSTKKMSYSAMRCFSKFIRDKGLIEKDEFTVKTLAGVVNSIILEDKNVILEMPKPVMENENIPFVPNNNLNYKMSLGDRIIEGTALSFNNNLHFVIFVEEDDDLDKLVKKYGRFIEESPEFPEKTNVEFVKIKSHKRIEVALWDRDNGITMGNSYAACASVIVGIINGFLEEKVDVYSSGGNMTILWEGGMHDRNVAPYVSSSAEYIFDAEWNFQAL